MIRIIVLFLALIFAAAGVVTPVAEIKAQSADHKLCSCGGTNGDCPACQGSPEHRQSIKQPPALISGPLTLDRALDLARENSPALSAARMEAEAADREIRQAGVWANPELDFEVEGVGGDMSGTASAEYTLALSQEFSLSGKPGKKREMARYTALAAEFAAIETELDLEIAVRKAFIETLARREIIIARAEQERLAREFADAARRRHKSGGASELELLEADVTLEKIAMAKARSEKALSAAVKNLALLIGLPDPGEIQGDLFKDLKKTVVPSTADSHPTLRRFQALEEQASAEAILEKADRIPDLTLAGGIRYIREEDIHTYVAGVSIPLPFFNTNQACCDAAILRAQAAEAATAEAKRELNREMANIITEFEIAAAEAKRCRDRLLPKTQRSYEICQEGYAVGRYSWMELIMAQQTLAETRIRYIEAQRDAWLALAELNKFIPGEDK
jgi:outer membrane protein, heavy metal efflux system